MKQNLKNKKRKIFISLITLILLSAAGLAFSFKTNTDNDAGKSINKEVVVCRGELKINIETTGEIVPNLEVEIKCKASGEITELPLDISDTVKIGDLLLQLDPEDEETSLKQAEVSLAVSQAEYEQAKVNLDLAKQNQEIAEIRANAALSLAEAQKNEYNSKYNRAKTLNDKNVVSDEIYETAYTAYVIACVAVKNAEADIKNLESLKMNIEIMEHNIKIAKAKVESSQLSLSDAQQRLNDVTVTAPINGVISSQDVQIGQIIASGVNNVDGGTTIMTIADLSKIFVLASVDESDIGAINEGQNAKITVDAYPKLSFPGRVVRIATTGKTVSSVVTFEVKIEVEGKNYKLLKPGMTADIKIVALEKNNVITVPAAAVTRKLQNQYITVKDKEGNSVERLVTIGESNGDKVEILEGINVGELVVVPDKSMSKWSNTSNKRKNIPPGGPNGPMGGIRV